MKRILLTLGVLISLHLHVFAQCDACDRTNPSNDIFNRNLVVAAGEIVCVTEDKNWGSITVSDGGTLNICNADVGGNLGVIVATTGEINVTGNSLLYSTFSGINSSGVINLNDENATLYAASGVNSNGELNSWTCADDGTLTRFVLGSGVISVDPLSLGGSCTPLPVELKYFNAKQVDNQILLNWVTATELDNEYFIIQRSENVQIWSTLDTVAGNGTSSIENEYLTYDNSPSIGNNYYRLIQYDYDGDSTVSKIIIAEFNKTDAVISIQPNPANEYLNIKLDKSDYQLLNIYSFSGELMESENIIETNEFNIDLSDFPIGTFFVQIKSNTGLITEKFIKQ